MRIFIGIASTTHLDRHYERITKSTLEDMARQVRERFVPQLIEHDPKQNIGVVLYGEVFQLLDGEHALGFVSGIFENEEEKIEFGTGKPNVVWKNFVKYLNIEELKRINLSNHNKNNQNINKKLSIADLLEIHLDSTQVLQDGTVYKIKRFVASCGDLRIEVYPKDHKHQPHFHVISTQKDINARFDLNTLDLLNMKHGKIRDNDIKKIQDFFKNYPEFLEKLKSEHTRLQ